MTCIACGVGFFSPDDLQSVESAKSKRHRKVMKKDILAVVDTATKFTKQFFLLFRKGISLIWLY